MELGNSCPGLGTNHSPFKASSEAGLKFLSCKHTRSRRSGPSVSFSEDWALTWALFNNSLGLGLQCRQEKEDFGEASTHAAPILMS